MSRLLEPPDGREVFELGFAPEPAHIDGNGHVNNVVYLAWAQELAISHWSARASAADQARWAWIILRHEVDYRRPLKLGETARGLTWVADTWNEYTGLANTTPSAASILSMSTSRSSLSVQCSEPFPKHCMQPLHKLSL